MRCGQNEPGMQFMYLNLGYIQMILNISRQVIFQKQKNVRVSVT